MFLNVSRVFTHELVRHRAGTAYSQESQRYVSFTEIPLTRTSDMSLEDELVLLQSANSIEKEYNSLTMRMLGKPFAIVKQLTSKFRRMIGQGVATNILMTANLRALQHIIALRTSEHAEVEIRDVFLEVERICRQEYPNIFQR
jgi:thymidylate synthase (FAD)